MAIITLLMLILMFITPIISVMSVLLQTTSNAPSGKQRRIGTTVIMILFSVGIHLLGARGLINNYLNLSSTSALIAMIITTLVTLLLGGALGLLVQDIRRNKT